MPIYFKLVNHGELAHFRNDRLLAYYHVQPTTTLQYPSAAYTGHGHSMYPARDLQAGDRIVLFQSVHPTSQLVTHLVEVTGPTRATPYPTYPWESPVRVVKQLVPQCLGGVTHPIQLGWPGAPGNPDGQAGGPPQLGHAAGARLGHLLGHGNTIVQGIQDGCVRYAISGHSIGANALGQFILNNPAYV